MVSKTAFPLEGLPARIRPTNVPNKITIIPDTVAVLMDNQMGLRNSV